MDCCTCGHEMTQLTFHHHKELNTYWCPRCGTISWESNVHLPVLIGKIRQFCRDIKESVST